MARRLLREAWNNRLDSVLEMSSAMQAVAHTTDDHKEALAAMREKRKPSYKGA
jgi:1,4-dihydroxy-2-naphthoyl-CoA synthase